MKLKDCLDKDVEARLEWVTEMYANREALLPHIRAIQGVVTAAGADFSQDYSGKAVVHVRTNDMKGAVARLLEGLTEACGADWGQSLDSTDFVGVRTFKAKDLPLTVNVVVPDEGDGCKRVQVGVQTVPVYKIVCDGDQS